MQQTHMGEDQIKKEPEELFNVSSTPFGAVNNINMATNEVKIEVEEGVNQVQVEPQLAQAQDIIDIVPTMPIGMAMPEPLVAVPAPILVPTFTTSETGTVIQVTNISPGANVTQMATLFGFLGIVEDCKLYPADENVQVGSKICYVKYQDPITCGVAQHLTNTVFIDRALIVVPRHSDIIPDEATALQLSAPANAFAGSMPGSTAGLLPTPQMSHINVMPGMVMPITQQFMGLNALGMSGIPPSLTGNIDPSKVEEIRRTVYVGNLDSSISAEQLLAFFSGVGEIRYVRLAGEEGQPTRGESTEDPTRFAFVEFTDMSAVATALQYNGVMFGGRPLKVNYSKNAIVKPETERPQTVKKENDKAMRQVRELEKLISGELDSPRRPRSRSRSRSRRRSRTRSRDRRRRSRRSRSPSFSRRRRSKTRSRSRDRRRQRRRSFSRSRSRSRSRSPSRPRYTGGRYQRDNRTVRRRSRTRSRTRSPGRAIRRSRSPSMSKAKKDTKDIKDVKDIKEKDKDGNFSRSPSRSPNRTSRKRYKKERRDRDRERSPERPRDRERGKDKEKERESDKNSKDKEIEKEKEKDVSRKPKSKKDSDEEKISTKDVEKVGGDSDMSLEDDDDTLTKKKNRVTRYESDDDSPKKKKKSHKKTAGSGSDFSD